MRKLTLELEPNERVKEELEPMFEIIHSLELLEIMKIDWEGGIRLDLIECHLKEDQSINEVKTIGDMEIISILKSEGSKHICLVKYSEPEESKDLFKQFNLNLIYATPIIMSKKNYTISVIGDQENLTRFVELAKTHLGEIENMTFKKAAYQKHDILSVLTDKQKEIIIAANRNGYYKYPRKIKTEELAQKIGISKGTTIEHLRKAEERLMENILAGY